MMNNTAATAPQTLVAHATYSTNSGAPMRVTFCAGFGFEGDGPAEESAREFAALFPKASKMRVRSVQHSDGRRAWEVITEADLLPTKGNTFNETGVKRYRRVATLLAKAGYSAEWTTPYGNSYETREAFEAAIA